ncbi:MAG: helix-turn-helix transcriptional regulator [Deltaproteobacteria bacterium]|nr:helix-turn-helix transcriptional regulator [Deltaproteobacteria bacterium]
MKIKPTCEITYIDHEKVATVRDQLLPETVLVRLAETFKVMGDPTRAKIIHAISFEELCVCDIACLLGTTKSAISHQLRILRNLRAVKFRKAGKIAYYSLDDTHIGSLFAEGLKHIQKLELQQE